MMEIKENFKRILKPPVYENTEAPVIFLAGPIQGARDWHDEAIEIIFRLSKDVFVACPKRDLKMEGDFSEEMYNEQVDWETHYLRRAGENGVILFWLAKEQEHKCDRAYAQTTRFELGEWKARHEFQGVKLVIGVEEGFTNTRYIKRRFALDCPNIFFYYTLEEVCAEAIRLCAY